MFIQQIKKKIHWIIQIFFLVLTHLWLLPIFSMLMNIFLCDYTVGNSLTDSFLNQDCRNFCYSGKHLYFAIITGLCLIIYLPASIYLRPYWELSHDFLHLSTKSYYLSVLSVVQVIIVILNKTLKPYDQGIHGCVVCLIILSLICFTIYSKPYNYKRAYVMQCISLTLALWCIFISTIFRDFKNLNLWFIVEIIGALIVFIFGFIFIGRYPLLIYFEQGLDISKMFLFQFGNTMTSESINLTINNLNSCKQHEAYMIQDLHT